MRRIRQAAKLARDESGALAAAPTPPDLKDPKYDHLFEGDPPKQLDHLLDVAKFQVDFQVKMAERLDSKARGLIGMTAVFAGAVQAFALRQDVLSELAQGPKIALIVAAALTAALLGVAVVLTAQSVVLRTDRELEPDWLMRKINPALEADPRVTAELVYEHLDLALSRKLANDDRADKMVTAERTAQATLGIAILEFVVAILTLL